MLWNTMEVQTHTASHFIQRFIEQLGYKGEDKLSHSAGQVVALS